MTNIFDFQPIINIAIVGSSHIYPDSIQDRDVRKYCSYVIRQYNINHTVFISGGADGVDTIALEVANGLGYKTKVYHPDSHTWPGYAARNKKIANACHELYCIAVATNNKNCYHHKPAQKHEKTAGCWTLNRAHEKGKVCHFWKI